MSVLSYQSIKKYKPLSPIVDKTVIYGRSFGVSGSSYDIRIEKSLWLWPFWGRLASAIEKFHLPNNICAVVLNKSTNARIFLRQEVTYIDAGFQGKLTLELTRSKPWPIYIRKGTPIAQVIFHWLDEPTEKPYAGKYQNQGSDQGAIF